MPIILPIALKGSKFSVSSPSGAAGLSIAGLANGDIAIAWEDGSNAAAQLFSGSGATASGEFLPALSGGASETLTNENVVALANGNFVVTWNDNVVIGANTFVTVDAQIYDPNLNTIGGTITVIPQIQVAFSGADVFATPDGGFAYAEYVNHSEYVQSFHADGTKNGSVVQTGPQFDTFYAATALTN